MIVAAANLVHYLLDRALLDRESVVEGDLTIADASRRNRNFRVVRRRSPGLFVKQAHSSDPNATATLQREATLYWLVKHKAELARLRPIVPHFQAYDPARCILITDLLQGESLAQSYVSAGFSNTSVATALGDALATVHGEIGASIEEAAQQPLFPKAPPWILSVQHSKPQWFANLSAANSQLIELVRAYPDFPLALDELRTRWSVESLVHGDIKWENCFVDGSTLRIVDWELADMGDPLWDVGGVLQSYLTHWVHSLPSTPKATPANLAQLGSATLDSMLPSVRAFWDAYVRSRRMKADDTRTALRLAVQYAGARMVQSVYEYMATSQQLLPNAFYSLQVSLNVLKDPDGASRDLLGLADA